MLDRITRWFEKFLEEPFYQAELCRAEILKADTGIGITVSLAGSLSHNYSTLKSWSK